MFLTYFTFLVSFFGLDSVGAIALDVASADVAVCLDLATCSSV